MVEFCQLNKKPNEKIAKDCSSNDQSSPQITNIADKVAIIKEMIKQCYELPNEWTVIQLCKRFNRKKPYQLKEEDCTEHLPLNITAFCYARSELLANKPFSIELHFPKGNLNV